MAARTRCEREIESGSRWRRLVLAGMISAAPSAARRIIVNKSYGRDNEVDLAANCSSLQRRNCRHEARASEGVPVRRVMALDLS